MFHPPPSDETTARVLALWDGGQRNKTQICRETGLAWNTIHKLLARHGRIGGATVPGQPSEVLTPPAGAAGACAGPPVPLTPPVLEALARALGLPLPDRPAPVAPGPEPEPEPAPDPEPPQKAQEFVRVEGADDGRVEFTSDRRIRTLEDALAFAEVDTAVWRVDRWECTSWETTLKVGDYAVDGATGKRHKVADRPVRKTMWRVKLFLKRVMSKALHDGCVALFERMKSHAPQYPSIRRPKPPASPHLLEVDLYDVHFGKLAWAPETGGQSYDLRIAERVFRNAAVDLLDCVANYEIERVCIPIGNDFFHIDNLEGTTRGGTKMDVDGRLAKIYEIGFQSFIWAAEYLAAVAPVDVLLVPGNHDFTTSYFLAHAVAVWFRNSDRVTVDHSPSTRKYLRYGVNLIGYTHGNEEPVKSLPGLMAQERPGDWGETRCREWRRGHWHKSKVEMTVPVDTHDGVPVRTLRALSGVDSWHYRKGYGGPRAGECYLMGKDAGFRGHFNADVRLD